MVGSGPCILESFPRFGGGKDPKPEQIELGTPIHAAFTEVSFSVVFYCVNELLKLVGTGVKDKRDEGRTQGG